ncbi:hypothetical protein DH2020_035058 [Rehmannia glutinosa]|uniref:Leucine carboxyl methyltransferase n=1 Tax=Rehmannia glutinosa TaxID=99300 RepID=A0ABR0V8N6_REHGL
MSNHENGFPEDKPWPELKLPELLSSETLKALHAVIERDWDLLQRSACQTAAGRALWKQVINDPLAELFAGETYLKAIYEKIKKDRLNNAKEFLGYLLPAGMDARSYRLSCLKEISVFEVDFAEVLHAKAAILEAAVNSRDEHHHPIMTAKSLTRVAADLTEDDWLEKLQISGFEPKKSTVWILEGILYYLSHSNAMKVLNIIAEKCNLTNTVLLADFMNKQATKLSSSTFHFYCDWPDQLLPSLGFSDVKLSQIGDPDAHFGLLQDPLNLFNKLRNLPRSVQTHPDDGTPCGRLYLLQASGSPNQTSS